MGERRFSRVPNSKLFPHNRLYDPIDFRALGIAGCPDKTFGSSLKLRGEASSILSRSLQSSTPMVARATTSGTRAPKVVDASTTRAAAGVAREHADLVRTIRCYEGRVELRKHYRAACALTLGATSTLGQVCCESRLLTLGEHQRAATGGATAAGSAQGIGGGTGQAGAGTDGGAAFEEPRFSAAELVTELAAELDTENDENPTLTANMLELYFTSTRVADGTLGAEDVWVARRTNGSDAFDAPILVTTVNTANPDSSPAISLDGQTLWLGVERNGGLGGRDIWRFARTSTDPLSFGAPVLEPNVNSVEDEIPRPLGNQERTMPLASRRGGTAYTTYTASRSSTSSDFSAPVPVAELVLDGYKTTDAFLTNDGLKLYFVRGVDDLTGDIYVAHRDTLAVAFGAPVALTTVNTPSDERDPWLSPDESTLYFVSDRDKTETRRIYRAERIIP